MRGEGSNFLSFSYDTEGRGSWTPTTLLSFPHKPEQLEAKAEVILKAQKGPNSDEGDLLRRGG